MRIIVFFFMFLLLSIAGQSQPVISGEYFGLPKPGLEAVLFAEGIISRGNIVHSAPAFSNDGNTVLWSEAERGKPLYLVQMTKVKGVWSAPTSPSFADTKTDDFYPRFSTDGSTLYFSSRRALPSNYDSLKDLTIWMVKQDKKAWTTPEPLNPVLLEGVEYSHSTAANGGLYYSFRKDNGKIFDIAYSRKSNGKYEKPMPLSNQINTTFTEDGPCIAPDESFLIFESSRPGGAGSNDLYISFKNSDGTWAPPKNMGPKVNTSYSERFAGLSPDGKYLFFGSDRRGTADVFWIDAKVIDLLR